MLDTGSPPVDEEKHLAAVLPPSSHHATATATTTTAAAAVAASRSSTPGVSSLDGTPRYLFSPSLAPSPPSLPPRPPSPDMAIKPALPPDHAARAPADSLKVAADMPSGQVLPPPAMHRTRSSLDSSPTRTAVPDEDRRPIHPLSEIHHVLRLQRYQKRRCHHAQENLHFLQIAAARTARLVRATRSVQHTLAECIRSEDKPSFVSLLHAFQDACDDSLRPTSAAILETESASASDFRPTMSFLDELSPPSRASILDLLGKLRYNGNFLANQLLSLTQKEILALLPDRSVPRSNESVLGSHSGTNSRSSRPLGFVVDAQVDTLSSFAYGSPLEALVFAVRGLSNTGSAEDDRGTDIWATVCAKLFSGGKAGSERLLPAIFDIWTSLLPWPGKSRLEVWILQTLQSGAFLLDHPVKQTFRARVEGRSDISADEELRAEQFYNHAADSLLELLGEHSGASVLPPGALKMCHVLIEKLAESPGHQRSLPHFVATRWLFSTFIMDAVTLPEAYGMLTDHFLSEIARQRILREVAVRAHKLVFDVAYSWKYGYVVASETMQRVGSVMARFQTPTSSATSTKSLGYAHCGRYDHTEPFLAVSAKDVLICLNALYPQRRPASVASDGDNLTPGLLSSSSSISGFSLFPHPKAVESLPDNVSRDVHSIRLGEPAGAVGLPESEDQSFDNTHMREACLELEDFTSGPPSASVNLWDVLHISPQSRCLQTMRQTCQELVSAAYPGGSLETPSKELNACARAVESLLREDNIALPLEVPHSQSTPYMSLLEVATQLEDLFQQSIQECESRSDFVKAHFWYRQLQDFQSCIFSSADLTSLLDVLDEVHFTSRRSLDGSVNLTEACDRWVRRLDTRTRLRGERLKPILQDHDRLRDKLWYTTDVRTTAAYDEARSVASALRIMGKPKRPTRTRLQPPLRHWSGPKLSSTSLHLKTEAQILEILSARPDHGGPNKLSDEQSKATELWMDRQNIDNLCRGEERLHKLCMEVRKCVENIMSAPTENSIVWSNVLFARDPATRQHAPAHKPNPLFPTSYGGTGQHSLLSFQTHLRSNDALSSTSKTLSSVSSRDYIDSRSPTLTNKSSVPFWSPAMTEVDSPSSATSVGSYRTQSALDAPLRKPVNSNEPASQSSLEVLRHRMTGLVLSDLTATLFSDGSETDRAFWSGLGWSLTDRHFRGLHALHTSIGSQTPTMASINVPRPVTPSFDFETAFRTLLQKFSAMCNPTTKLACLYDIDRLLVPYMADRTSFNSPVTSFVRKPEAGQLASLGRMKDATGVSVSGFREIFSKASLRPTTIFRDLQYIAALLPCSVLQNTPEGKSFCNAAVAISGLKQEARSLLVETADNVIAYHSNNRGHGKTSSTAQQQRDSATFTAPSRTPSAEDVSRYTMADAAYLLQITAKEGDPVAQRELATLYLTHPELMDPIIAPFARPKDVFKDELEGKWRKNQDPNRCDPALMCVAHHWMSLSSKGGDSLAKEYLRQREEMDSF